MAYVLVMGGLALSVFFTFGWMLLRTSQWLWRQRPGGAQHAAGGKATGGYRKATAKVKPRTPAKRQAASPRSQSSAKAASKPARADGRSSPSEPWGMTRWLSRRRSALPLSCLAVLLYGLARLAEFGITQRTHDAPAAYHALVAALGWVASVLLALALVNLFARWRCRPR